MEAPFKRYLIDFYKSYLYEQSMSFLKRYFTNELMFEDEKKERYRSPREIAQLEEDVGRQCEIMSRELVDELEAQGIISFQNFENADSLRLAEATLEGYLKKLEKYLRELQ